MKTHPPGTIALPLGAVGRCHDFTLSLATLEMPEGTTIASVKSMDVTANLNSILSEMFRGEWAWFIADDHSWEPDSLLKLLDREVDVVVPMVCKKAPPFRLVDFTGEETRTFGDGREYPHYLHIDMADLPRDGGLVPVHAAGSAGMLVRRHVLEEIGAMGPWFENPHGTVINDDLEFCRKIRECGYTVYLDTEVYLTHIGEFKVYPGLRDGIWGIYLDFGGAGENRIFMASEPITEEMYAA